MPRLALIRGFGDEPLCRAVIGPGNGVVFVTSLRQKSEEYQMLPPAIGVPMGDVFVYDPTIFEHLRERRKSGGKIGETDWGEHFNLDEMKEAAN